VKILQGESALGPCQRANALFLPLVSSNAVPDVIVTGDVMSASAKPKPAPALTTLTLGKFRDIAQDLPINIVFVGYEADADLNAATFSAGLPDSYRAINRYPSFYRQICQGLSMLL
jgi:hypothetical protein